MDHDLALPSIRDRHRAGKQILSLSRPPSALVAGLQVFARPGQRLCHRLGLGFVVHERVDRPAEADLRQRRDPRSAIGRPDAGQLLRAGRLLPGVEEQQPVAADADRLLDRAAVRLNVEAPGRRRAGRGGSNRQTP